MVANPFDPFRHPEVMDPDELAEILLTQVSVGQIMKRIGDHVQGLPADKRAAALAEPPLYDVFLAELEEWFEDRLDEGFFACDSRVLEYYEQDAKARQEDRRDRS